jgi:sugar fermentation stimulation protein A
MNLPQPLHEARLIRRYKRFLSDMRLADGREVVAHCPNPGSMKTCAGADWRVQISHNTNPRRKLKWTWELAYDDLGHPILINTSRPNAIVEEAVRAGGIAELTGYPSVRREVRYGAEKSRIDLLLSGPDRPDCYVEIKSVTMRSGELGAFPDSVTKRGQRHLRELTAMAAAGHRAVLFFSAVAWWSSGGSSGGRDRPGVWRRPPRRGFSGRRGPGVPGVVWSGDSVGGRAGPGHPRWRLSVLSRQRRCLCCRSLQR